jgi:hypothetical protein
MHLDAALYERMKSNQLSPEERTELSRHLLTECEQCERFLDSQPQDALDLLTDVALADNAKSYPPHRASKAKVIEATSPHLTIRRRTRWSQLAGSFGAGALAASLIAFAVTRAPSNNYTGEKGAGGPQVELGGMVSTPSPGGARALTPLQAGAKISSDAELYLTWQLPAAAYVYVGRVSGDEVEPFYPPGAPEKEDPGMHSMTVQGVVHSYSLDGLKGKQRFVLVATDNQLSPDELKQALKQEKLGRGSVAGFGVSVEEPSKP